MITAQRLCSLAMGRETPLIDDLAVALDAALSGWAPLRVAHFLAQTCFESQQFTRLVENLRYTHADRIAAVWPRLGARAASLTNNPEALANAAYNGRMGNGVEATGDGAKFIGRGLIQLTGRDNYTAAADATGLPLVDNPDMASEPSVAVTLAIWFWHVRACDPAADADNVVAVTEKINGPALEGLTQRKFLTNRAKRIFV